MIRGQVDLVCDLGLSLAEAGGSGHAKAYAMTSAVRRAPFVEISTTREQGLGSLDVVAWHGVYLPKGVPNAATQMLVSALRSAVNDPIFKLKMVDLGGQAVSPADASPKSLEKKLVEESARWSRVMQWVGITKN